MLKVKIDDHTSKAKEYTLKEILQEPGVYEASVCSEDGVIIVGSDAALWIGSYNELMILDKKSWASTKFIKSNRVVTICNEV